MHPEKTQDGIKNKDSSKVGDSGVECFLTASNITFPNDHSTLSNTKMLIRDTGATYHSSFDDGGSEKIVHPRMCVEKS